MARVVKLNAVQLRRLINEAVEDQNQATYKRAGYHRKGYTRKGGVEVSPSDVGAGEVEYSPAKKSAAAKKSLVHHEYEPKTEQQEMSLDLDEAYPEDHVKSKEHQAWLKWLDAYYHVLEKEGVDPKWLPIYDVVEDTRLGDLAIEQMQFDFFKNGKSPEEAVELVLDLGTFSAEYYDPYEDEYRHELHMDDEDDQLDEADLDEKGFTEGELDEKEYKAVPAMKRFVKKGKFDRSACMKANRWADNPGALCRSAEIATTGRARPTRGKGA